MSNRFDLLGGCQFYFGQGNAAQTKAGLALGSAYTYATAGAAIGVMFVAPTSGNLTDVWFFVTTTTGAGNPPGVTTVELRNYNSTNKNRPGTTQHAVQTITPGVTDNKWINAHFTTPYSVTKGITYWIVIADAGWTSGHTATVDYKAGIGTSRQMYQLFQSVTTADGFAADPTKANLSPAMVLKFADGTIYGNPFTTNAGDTSNTLERGIKIVSLTEDLTICGVIFTGSSSISGLKIYSGATAPLGTTDVTITFGAGEGYFGAAFFAPFTLRKNKVYRIVFTYNGSTTYPQYYQIEDYATTTDVTNCGFAGGKMYRTLDNNDGTWADQIDMFPQMALIIQYQSVQPGALIDGGAIAT
jgi:hypothetical protein